MRVPEAEADRAELLDDIRDGSALLWFERRPLALRDRVVPDGQSAGYYIRVIMIEGNSAG